MNQYNAMHDALKEITHKYLTFKVKKKIQQKKIQICDRSYSFPGSFWNMVSAHIFHNDDSTLYQSMKIEADWPLWLESLRKELLHR